MLKCTFWDDSPSPILKYTQNLFSTEACCEKGEEHAAKSAGVTGKRGKFPPLIIHEIRL